MKDMKTLTFTNILNKELAPKNSVGASAKPEACMQLCCSGQMWLQHLRIKRILQHAAKHLGSKSRGSRNITHLWCYIYTEGLWRWWKIISQTHLQGFYPWWSLAVKTTILSEKHETRCWPMSSHFQMSGGMDRNNRKATEKWNTWLSSIFMLGY